MDALTRAAPTIGADRYTVRWQPRPDARLRLFALPHTGGGAGTFRAWAALLPPRVELVAIRLPGRESRFHEPAFDRIGTLVDGVLDALAAELDRPYAWLGHSMGALVAYELCRAARRRGLPEPARLIVAGRRAPHLPATEPTVHDAPDAQLAQRLRDIAGTPEELLDTALLRPLLPLLRADFAVSETYRWTPEPPLRTPISALGGSADPLARPDELAAWSAHTTGGCGVRLYPGDHFFLHHRAQLVVPDIAADLRE